MTEHPWMQKKDSVALCPKCSKPALRRSHSHSKFEKIRKKYSTTRPFRCHACQWRGWMDESLLRYPIGDNGSKAWNIVADNTDIPVFSLDDDEVPSGNITNSGIQLSDDLTDDPDLLPDPVPLITGDALRDRNSAGVDMHQSAKPFSEHVSDDFHQSTRHRSQVCPQCKDVSLHRSRVRSLVEAFRRRFTQKHPYRCHKCGWRGWMTKSF